MNKNNLSCDVLKKKTSLNHFLLIMRTAIILLFTCVFISVAETGHSQNAKVSLNKNNVNLKEVLNEIENQTDYLFIYNNEVNTNKTVSVKSKNRTVREVLNHVLRDSNIDFSMEGNHIILSYIEKQLNEKNEENIETAQQQGRTITGTIIDPQGEPIIGANIIEKGTSNGTITDFDGKFTLQVGDNAVLRISYIGYLEQEVSTEGRNTFNITLLEDTKTLDELVVIGYGTMRKSDITGAVASVDKDKITRQPVANVGSALQGLATGVSVTSNSGTPGSSATIRIRGVGTVNDANPLYVVDGMPVTDINYLSASDIESMEILKDASASAIYGSRGANGVILITTKGGTVGKTTVTFDAYWGVNKLLNKLDLMSGPEWYSFQSDINEVKESAGTATLDLSRVDKNQSTDWIDEISRSAFMHNYSVGVSGGRADDYKYNFGFNYLNQDGTIKKSEFERISLRQNTEKTILKDFLMVGTNMTLAKSNSSGISEFDGSGLYDGNYGVISNAIRVEPVIPAKNPDGTYGYSPYIDYNNPLADIDYPVRGANNLTMIGNIYGELNILKGLKFKSNFGAEIRREYSKDFRPVYFVSSTQRNNENYINKSEVKGDYYTWENTLSYNNTFAEKHSLNVVAGYTNEWGKRELFNIMARDIIGEDINFHYIDATMDKSKTTASNSATDYGMISYLGRVHYDYDNRYLITASFRRDGSSKFSAKNRWGNFPSLALGWRIDNESFFKKLDLDFISSLKLRIGWGQIGNQNIGSNLNRSLLSMGNQFRYLFGNGSDQVLYQGMTVLRMGNDDIRWETTESSNIGLDASFLNNRLIFSFEYYNKDTKDMLLAAPMPIYMGYVNNTYENIGAANNRGVEMNIEWRDKIGDFDYNVSANMSTIRNRMISLNGGTPISDGVYGNFTYRATYTNEGLPIGTFWGYKTNGLIQTQEQLAEVKKTGYLPNAELGDIHFVDTNKDGFLNEDDQTVLGNPIPDIIYGFNIGLGWKGFDFSMQWGGTIGNDIYNTTRLYINNTLSSTQKERKMLNYWTPTNTDTNVPRLTATDANNNMRVSDRFVEDGSYLRLRNAQIGYTLPNNVIEKVKLQKVRIYLSGQNLLTFTNYSGLDPEVGQSTSLTRGMDYGIYPQSIAITGGINITF